MFWKLLSPYVKTENLDSELRLMTYSLFCWRVGCENSELSQNLDLELRNIPSHTTSQDHDRLQTHTHQQTTPKITIGCKRTKHQNTPLPRSRSVANPHSPTNHSQDPDQFKNTNPHISQNKPHVTITDEVSVLGFC